MTRKLTIVCLCGSTRFYEDFIEANLQETMQGKIVLSVGVFGHSDKVIHGRNIELSEQDKTMLDKLHKEKILLSDEILVINRGGYIGSSTRSEINFAMGLGKDIRYLYRTGEG